MDKLEVTGKGASFIIKVLGANFSNQLEIPHDFTKIFNGYVPHRFFIENSMTKKCWKVEVEKDGDGKTYFRNGWSTFAEDHCLEFGNFLLFEYEEQSILQVKLYDRNGCQKNTFSRTNESRPNLPKVTDMENDSSAEALQCESKIFRKDHGQKPRLSAQKYNNGIYKKRHEGPKKHWRSRVGGIRTSFSFMLVKKYQFSQKTIPSAVVIEKNLASKEEVVLQDDDTNCWPVKVGHKKSGQTVFLGGWKQFLDGNNIALGDILDIKFVSDKLAQVHVTRSSEREDGGDELKCNCKDRKHRYVEGEHGSPQDNYATKDQTFEASLTTGRADDEHECPWFSIPWSKGRALRYLYIPKEIVMRQQLKDKESITLCDEDGKCWPLVVKKCCNGRMNLTKGWYEFCKGLSIEDGDYLEFHFVSHRLFQVKTNRLDRPCATTIREAAIDVENGASSDLLA